MKTEIVHLSQIQVNGANPRIIKDDKFGKLVNSILVLPKMLELRPIVVDNTMVALGGNMRFRALTFISDMSEEEIKSRLTGIRDYQKKTQAEQDNLVTYWVAWKDKPITPVIKASDLSDEEQREFIIKDNVGFGEWDMDALANEWDSDDLNDWGVDVWNDPQGGSDIPKLEGNSLNDRFIVPPFSILDTRKGYWQARKKIWREKIGDMGESRNDTNIASLNMKYVDLFQKTREHREQLGISFREYFDKYVSEEEKEREGRKVVSAGVSLLDPVMSELVCRWFGLDNCKTFDCFAGDSVFGHVSTSLGNEFTGIELRQEQVDLNNSRVEGMNARYICDDGQNVAKHIEPESQDLLFSCPPYFDLEVYSDKENDASNQDTYEDFIAILDNAFKSAVGCLKNNRFAVVVVGDIRNKKTGGYYGFHDDIKRIFKEAGCLVYNEIILVESGGASLAIRAGRFMNSRKVGKMHQNILVFYKGDTSQIKKNFPRIDISKEDEQAFSQEFTAEGGEQQEEEFPND